MTLSIEEAITKLKQGQVIIYPTESVYGMGCDAFNQQAYQKINSIKQRPESKPFILLIDSVQSALSLASTEAHQIIKRNPDGLKGVTWVLPASLNVPPWCQSNGQVALRISTHPVASQLVKILSKPLVSTSVNISGGTPLSDPGQADAYIKLGVAGLVSGQPGGAPVTRIVQPLTGKVLRG